MSTFSQAARSGVGSTSHAAAGAAAAASVPMVPLNPSMPSRGRAHGAAGGVVDLSKQLGRADHAAAGSSSVAAAPADPAGLRMKLVGKLRELQANLSALQALHALEPASLDSSTFDQTETILFGSRGTCRELAALMKQHSGAPAAAAAAATAASTSEAGGSTGTVAGLQPTFLALQSAVEKAATLLLAKHKQQHEFAAALPGAKRKRILEEPSGKRIKGGIIQPEHTAERERATAAATAAAGGQTMTAKAAAASMGTKSTDPTAQVDSIASQVLSLQMLQSKLAAHAREAGTPPRHASSGSSTPSAATAGGKLRLTSARPHAIVTLTVAPPLLDDERMDDSPHTSRSSRSNVSTVSSAADSESEGDASMMLEQREEMIRRLMENVEKLRERIEREKAEQKNGLQRPSPPPPAQQHHQHHEESKDGDADEDAYADDTFMSDAGDLVDSSSPRDAAGSSLAPPPTVVPRLDLAALTSTCSALETLLQKSLTAMAELAVQQERQLKRRQTRQEIVEKKLVAPAPGSELTSTFPSMRLGGATFARAGSERLAGESTTAATSSDGDSTSMSHTDAARSLEAVTRAVQKKSDVPRVRAAVFGAAERFPSAASKQSAAAQRKALYDKYEQLYLATKLALKEAERRAQTRVQDATQQQHGPRTDQDEIVSAYNATRPRLTQNVSMGPGFASTAGGASSDAPKSLAAQLAQHTREAQARREQARGPGAYEVEAAEAITQRRVGGVTSWGPGPRAVDPTTGDDSQQAKTARLTVRHPASGAIGPGGYVVSEALTTKRVPGPVYHPSSAGGPGGEEETEQQRRVRELQAPTERLREQYAMEVDYSELDKTTRKKVPGLGALMAPPTPGKDVPNLQQARAARLAQERLEKIAAEAYQTEERIEELAQTRRANEEAIKTARREEFLKAAAEDEADSSALDRTARRLAIGPPDQGDLFPNVDYILPRKPVFRFGAPPKTPGEVALEATKHGASARKRGAAMLAKQGKREEEQARKEARLQEIQRRMSAAPQASATAMATMLGRPHAQTVDARDYEAARAKDFVQQKHAPGDDWSRAAARPVAEADLNPEVDDIIGGADGDVLDLVPSKADRLTKPRTKGARFGPQSGPDPSLKRASDPTMQTLSDTELDYANGVEEEREVLYPNYDFTRKRQGVGGALRFDKMVLGGSRSDPDADEDDEDAIFPYLAEGNAVLHPRWTGVEPKPKGGRFAVRRAEFKELHRKAKERERERELEKAGQLVLNPHLSTATLRHKPAASLAFSGRHDGPPEDGDDDLEDVEGLGVYQDEFTRKTGRGGPAVYAPRYAFRDAHTPKANFGASAAARFPGDGGGADGDLADEFTGDNRDYLGGIHASRPDPSRIVPASSLPGVDFGRRTGRAKPDEDDLDDFPEMAAAAEGDRLNLNPNKSATVGRGGGGGGLVNMARATGRPEQDDLDIEADGVRLDLQKTDGLKAKKVPGAAFSKLHGRSEQEEAAAELALPEGDTDLDPNYRAILARAPTAVFTEAARFPSAAMDQPATADQMELDARETLTKKSLTRSAHFGSERARPLDLAAEQAKLALLPEKLVAHTPGVDFAHGAARMQPLPPLADGAGLQSSLVLNPNHAYLHPTQPAVGFPDALRWTPEVVQERSSQLALDLVTTHEPYAGAGGISFPRELRPNQQNPFAQDKQPGSVLHPEWADGVTRRAQPEWSFAKEKRFESKMDNWLDIGGDSGHQQSRLNLSPDKSAIEPKSPAAFFTDALRPSIDGSEWDADGMRVRKSDEQVLRLSPNIDAVRARHPVALASRDRRFRPVGIGAVGQDGWDDEDTRKQLNLHPNLDAVRPKSPAARVIGRPKEEEPLVEGHRVRLYPNAGATYPNSPAAHITDSARSNEFSGRGRLGYTSNDLSLHPNEGAKSRHPTAPAYTLGARHTEAHYTPTNAELRDSLAHAEAQRVYREIRRRRPEEEEEDGSTEFNLESPQRRATAAITAMVLGPSVRRARTKYTDLATDIGVVRDGAYVDDADEAEPDASSSSLDGSFSLPHTGVVANVASLVRARREKATMDERRERERELRRSATKASRPSPPDAATEAFRPATRQEASGREETIQPSASPSRAAVGPFDSATPTTEPPHQHRRPPSPPSPLSGALHTTATATRKTVKFAEEDEEQEAPLIRPAAPTTTMVAGKKKKPNAIGAAAAASSTKPLRPSTAAVASRTKPPVAAPSTRPPAPTAAKVPVPQRSPSPSPPQPTRPILKTSQPAASTATAVPSLALPVRDREANNAAAPLSQRGLSEYLAGLRLNAASNSQREA